MLELVKRIWRGFPKSRRKTTSDSVFAARNMIITAYESFCEILSLNDSMLQLIADIEDRVSGQVPFSFNAISRKIRRAGMDIFVMASNLNTLASGRYKQLFDSIKKINASIESELGQVTESIMRPLAINLKNVRAGDAKLVGSKMANLGEVKNVLKLQVPDGFVITVGAFNRLARQENLFEKAENLEEVYESYGPRVAAEACRAVKQQILNASLPEDIRLAVEDLYDEICGGKDCLMAVRSSAAGEDSTASHAGVYLTELNINRSLILESYLWVVASAFSLPAVAYRLEQGLLPMQAQMAVGCLKMINPKYSGIMFSRPLDDFDAEKISISLTAGLSDNLTRGNSAAQEITVAFEDIKNASTILNKSCLEDLYMAARLLERHFDSPQDIEWAIDDSETLYILQTRPLLAPHRGYGKATEIRFSGAEILLEGGHTACPGVAAGEVRLIDNESDLEGFPQGGILVAPHSSPSFSVVMNRAKAIVTDRGSPIGHMAILAREFGVPTIVGLERASETLTSGMTITVDAGSKRIYKGVVSDILTSERQSAPLLKSMAVKRLKDVARYVTPLNLIDTAAPNFSPENCRTMHDVTRFIHEKIFEVMFHIGEQTEPMSATFRMSANLPYDVYLLDLGGGVAKETTAGQDIELKDILSEPLKAFVKGLTDSRINWSQPRAISASGFLSVLGQSMAGPPPEQRKLDKASFAIVSDKYMNFSTKAGYHFSTVDTYCGNSLNKNYIHFRFEGGAAAETRRERRCRFLLNVLSALEFKVQCRRDTLVARMEKYDRGYLLERLEHLGRLTICSRQLDMLMDTDESPDFFARAFLDGQLERF